MNFAINHEHIREMERNRFLYSELFFFSIQGVFLNSVFTDKIFPRYFTSQFHGYNQSL